MNGHLSYLNSISSLAALEIFRLADPGNLRAWKNLRKTSFLNVVTYSCWTSVLSRSLPSNYLFVTHELICSDLIIISYLFSSPAAA